MNAAAPLPASGRQLRSTLAADGTLSIAVTEVPVTPPGQGQVLVRIEAAPINPSDLMTLFASADPAALRRQGDGTSFTLAPEDAARNAGRIGQPLSVGLEGAGTVIGAGPGAEHLLGRRVAALSLTSGTWGDYAVVGAQDCMPLAEEVTTREGAGLFCNPMTAMAIVETVRLEGHRALIHTAAASNLGQMLARLCLEDGMPLVNVVRRREQVDLLRNLGAVWVVDSSLPTFAEDLREAIAETGATIAFDAIGGGTSAQTLLSAMEDVAAARLPAFSPYGSAENKQVFLYGHLDPAPIALDIKGLGMIWELRHWAMPATMARVSPERAMEMTLRVAGGLKTTFASHFSREVSLDDMLDPDVLRACARTATGEKYLLNPTL